MITKRIFRIVLIGILYFYAFNGFAQETQKTVTGTVTDSTGTPVANASVLIKGTKTGTQTASNGTFSLNVPAGATTLVVSSIGFENEEVPIGDGSVTVTLKASSESLANVTVVSVGYGTLNKREVSSAITHLSANDLTKVASNSPLMSIQGKVAGLSVTNTAAADPNSTPSIQLRGVSSRNAGLGPLYVINGIPGGNIDNINQNDIESIDVLKGGAASAIYGTRGSNGVIVITTKKGTSEPHTFYEGYGSFDYATNKLHVLSKEDFLANKRGIDYGGNTDWMKAVSRNPAFTQKHTLQFSGGSSRTNYFASADYRNAQGIDLRASKEEYGGRVNLNHTSANNLYTVTLNVAPRYAKTNVADYSGFNYALTLNPTLPIYDSAGRYAYITTGFFANNPVEAAKTVLSQQQIKELDISGSFKLNILKNLSTTATVGEVSRSLRSLYFTPSTNTTVVFGTGRNTAQQKLDEDDQKSFEWIGNYSLDIQKHSFKLLGGYSYQLFTSSGFNASNEDFPSDVLTYNNLGTGIWNLEEGINGVGSYKNSSKLIAFFGRLNYDFNKKYYLSGSLRREGSSKFGINNKWGYFPAASVAWRIDQEAFMQNISWLSGLKLRADYGVTGNQDFGNYLSLDTYSGYGYYVFNGVTYQVWGPSQNTNYDLRWEKAINFNVGVDFELLKNRISGSLNYYIRTNKDLLGYYSVPNPPNIQGTTYANVGTMKNSGLEIQISASAVKSKNFSYDVSFAGATNSNKFVSFSNDLFKGQTYIDVVGMPAPGSPGTVQRLQEGTRIGSFYSLKSAGYDVFGRLLVYDKEGKIIPANSATNDDKQFTGNGLPKFTASLGNTFRYKNWDLSIFLRGAFGYDLFNIYAFYLGTPAAQADANVLTSAYDGGKYSKLTNAATYSSLSDYFLEPGDFVKIDNVMLGYTKSITSKYIRSVRVYASSRNLYTFTKFTGGDPDLIQVNGLYPGINLNGDNNGTLNYYPSTIQVLFGLQVNF
ncbi:SusC/RagA family TonB-linked outer membrane protein [Ilyomonas limi]|uniref:SusC/RagA family TonB-linked outer membrane protein n=1 Tax=Ilyomonas limi TaxID=2575867 RepID=A0A4V5UUN6_9BACT|nr:SusC/RagA family TonB-linked outer membrane protein [Ilyomonas limi]TKK69813.1 SusC/RagA family TonB-linked outer membrane protein [Ilyomonas limi]